MLNCSFARSLCAGVVAVCLAGQAFAADAPAAAKPFTLRVLDAGTKQPIAKATIKANLDNGKTVRGETDADGSYSSPISPTSRFVRFTISDPTHVQMTLTWRPSQEPGEDHYDTMLPAALPINGRVQDEAGEPVAGATVVLSMNGSVDSGWPHPRTGMSWEQVKTDADGAWNYSQAPEDISTLSIGVWHPQYLANNSNEGYYGVDRVNKPEGLRDGSHVLTLKKGIQITGHVLDADGKPVPKATVAVGRDRVASNVIPPVKVDADGKFVVGGVAGQPITLTAVAKGLAPDLQTFVVTDPPTEITFKLGPPQTLVGHVTDGSGKPIGGAQVYIDTWRGCRTIGKSLSTDSSGKFTWKEAPADEVFADVMDRTHAAQRRVSMTAGKDMTVKLVSPLTIQGTVVDDTTGQPVPKFTILRGLCFNDNEPMRWERGNFGMGDQTGANGKFTADFNETYPGMGVRVEAPGYLPVESPVWKVGDGLQTFEFRMKQGKDVSAIVTDKDGKPVSGADAVLVMAGQPLQLENGRVGEYAREFQKGKTDAAGKFSFPPQTGAYLVAVFNQAGYAEVAPAQLANADSKVTLTPWARVEGTMFIGSKPAAGAIADAQVFEARGVDWQKQPSVMTQNNATVGEDGKFVIERLLPGKTVQIGRRVPMSDRGWSYTAMTKVDLKAGETATVRIGGVGRPVAGSIKLEGPLAGQHWGYYNAQIRTKQAEMPGLPKDFDKLSPDERRKRFEAWRSSEEGKAFFAKLAGRERMMKYYSFVLAEDGTFRADDVEAGTYDVSVQLYKPSANNESPVMNELGMGQATVVVPAAPGGQSDEVVQMDPIIIKPREMRGMQNAAPASQPAQ